MTSSEALDFKRLREDAVQQAARIHDLRAELQKLFEGTTEPPIPLNPGIPPLSGNRPLMLSTMDRIQSRLSQLAAALSPSNRSTPVHKPSTSSEIRLGAKFNADVDTPDDESSSSSSSEEFLHASLNGEFGAALSALNHKLVSKMRQVEAREKMMGELADRIATEIDARQKDAICRIIDRLQTKHPDITGSGIHNPSSCTIEDKIKGLKITNREELLGILDEVNNNDLVREAERIFKKVASLQTRPDPGAGSVVDATSIGVQNTIVHIRNHYKAELSKLSKYIMRLLSQGDQATPDYSTGQQLQRDNAELSRECRRLKMALSKWKIDCLNHESTKLSVGTAPTGSQQVAVGENFHELANTLSRMWEALPPTANDCSRLLSRISQAIRSQGRFTLSDALKDECTIQVEKLPLAELAARREFLLAKTAMTDQENEELQIVTANLESLITEFEDKHKERFFFEGEQYMHNVGTSLYHRP